MEILNQTVSVIRNHLQEVVFGITTVTLVLAGPYINNLLKKITAKFHWVLRFICYIILCCAGYGFLTHYLYQTLIKLFVKLEPVPLVVITLVSYLILAWLAKQHKQI
jgi:Protein of unknown function (DUF3392)